MCSIIRNGIRNSSCRVSERNIDSFGLPIDWKKFCITIWHPTTGGFNYGANKWDRVKRTLSIGIWLGVAITTVGFAVTELFPDTISAMFTNDETLIGMYMRLIIEGVNHRLDNWKWMKLFFERK